jgi:hypothetical protein
MSTRLLLPIFQAILLLICSCIIPIKSHGFDPPDGIPELSFIENVGQVTDQYGNGRPDIDFKISAAKGLNIFLGGGKIVYQWSGPEPFPTEEDTLLTSQLVAMYRMDVSLKGANPNPRISAEFQAPYREHYYYAGLYGKAARSYKMVIYHDVYPFIDWVFYINPEGKLEHDFVVRSGGRVSDIRLDYKGASNLSLEKDGSLLMKTPMGNIREKAPIAFEQSTFKNVPVSFRLKGESLSFNVGSYTGNLIIDPTIEWSTYLGGTLYDAINGITTNKDGYVYAVGATSSTASIATVGSYQVSFGGGANAVGADAMLLKFDADGNCIWTTYYGGTGVDIGRSIAVDTLGNIYIAGQTNSQTGMGTAATHRPAPFSPLQNSDAFLAKFDTSGQRIWGTYFGGDGNDGDIATALACSRDGGIYLGSRTESETGISTPGAFQAVKSSGLSAIDGFLARFNTSGNLDWATYYGGTLDESIYSISIDSLANLYLSGSTNSDAGIATPGVYQSSYGGGDVDGFVAKFDAAGQRLWGTYFGGDLYDIITGAYISLDSHLYLVGNTTSSSGIASALSHQQNFGGNQDAFLAKFSLDGQRLWSTYYGGAGADAGSGIAEGIDGAIMLMGITTSPTQIASPQAMNPNLNGVRDLMLASFQPDGTRNWGTYLGGNQNDYGNSITADRSGNVYIGGRTNSPLDIVTPGAHQMTLGGGYDAYLLKINTCEQIAAPASITGPATICEGDTVVYRATTIPEAESYSWILPTGWSGNSLADSIEVVIGSTGAVIKVAAINACGSSDTTELAVTVHPAPVPVIQRNGHILNATQVFTSYQWKRNGLPITGANGASYLAVQNGIYTLTVTNANNCLGTSALIAIDNITGIIQSLEQAGVKIYPNPVDKQLQVYLPFKGTVSLSTITGVVLITKASHTGDLSLDMEKLAAGLYLLRITDSNGAFVGGQKIIKK